MKNHQSWKPIYLLMMILSAITAGVPLSDAVHSGFEIRLCDAQGSSPCSGSELWTDTALYAPGYGAGNQAFVLSVQAVNAPELIGIDLFVRYPTAYFDAFNPRLTDAVLGNTLFGGRPDLQVLRLEVDDVSGIIRVALVVLGGSVGPDPGPVSLLFANLLVTGVGSGSVTIGGDCSDPETLETDQACTVLTPEIQQAPHHESDALFDNRVATYSEVTEFQFGPIPPTVGKPVQFTATPVSGANPPFSFCWDFENDGTLDTPCAEYAVTGLVSHSYAVEGTFFPRLRIVDVAGNTVAIARHLNVQPQSPPENMVNIIRNPSFEDGLNGWAYDPTHAPGTNVTIDTTRFVDGTASAKISVPNRAIGFNAFYQLLPSGTTFQSLADDSGGFDAYFYLEPQLNATLGDLQIKFLSVSARELNYVFDPDPSLLYPNQTFYKFIFLRDYPAGQWHHFRANIRADWAAVGFSLSEILWRVQFDGITFCVGYPSCTEYRSEIIWLDNVKLFAPSQDLQATIIANATEIRPGQRINFRAEISGGTPPYGDFQWVFCPSTIPASCSPSTATTNPVDGITVQYLIPGTYTVTFHALDANRLVGSDSITVRVASPTINPVDRDGWHVPWQVSANDGIVLNDVTFNGAPVLREARLPGILVSYVNSSCFFYDELMSSWVRAENIFIEDSPMGGFQIRADYDVPGYLYQQIWRFLPDGTFLGLLEVGGGGCFAIHTYEARWRYDFNLSASDMLLAYDGSSWVPVDLERELLDSNVGDPTQGYTAWQISGDGRSYFFAPFDTPEPSSTPGTLLAVLNRAGEIENSHVPGIVTPYVYLNNETLDGQDTALWYISRHSHNPFEELVFEQPVLTGLIFYPTDQPLPPDFSMTAIPPALNLQPTSFAETVITLRSLSGFEGNVSLTVQVSGPGLTAALNQTSVVLLSGGTGHSVLTVAAGTALPGNYTVVVTGMSGSLNHSVQISVVVKSLNIMPVALFSFSPTNPSTGQPVLFDGTNSTDPDGFIVSWFWSFGDGITDPFGPRTTHTYFASGTYTVTLTVTDNMGGSASTSQTVAVRPRATHDVAVDTIRIEPSIAVSGQQVVILAGIRNLGFSTETVNVTAYYDSQVAGTRIGVVLDPTDPFAGLVFILWDTTDVPLGSYVISVTVFLPTDENPSDNTRVDGTVTILPPPTLTAAPSSGSLGTRVVVQGSGFPPPPATISGPSLVLVSFDDMFVGFIEIRDGQFEFVLNVPHAEPGSHLIKAFDPFTGVRVSTVFTVLPGSDGGLNPSSHVLVIVVDTGAVYFPGDRVDVFILATVNGTPVSAEELELELTLVMPGGGTTALTASWLGSGLFTASYSVSRTGPLGTYAIVARAHHDESGDASALRSFEVKPTWISREGPRIATGLTLATVMTLAVVAWQRGYFRKKEEEPPLPTQG